MLYPSEGVNLDAQAYVIIYATNRHIRHWRALVQTLGRGRRRRRCCLCVVQGASARFLSRRLLLHNGAGGAILLPIDTQVCDNYYLIARRHIDDCPGGESCLVTAHDKRT